ncbi:MAG TPA: hypothetical protein DCZ10_09810, partial [Pelotomaculum sp.]|nr:hypothetical protein [Pelotomaculum sp.]
MGFLFYEQRLLPTGMQGGKVMIKKINAAFFLVLCLLPVLSCIAAALPSDISGHWAEKQIEDWISQSLASGYPDGTFQPDSLITRAEFMALINRAFGFTGEAPINFQDVQSTDWYAAEVAKAIAGGYISGYGDGTIRPNDNITREEAAAMLTRICKLETPDNIDDKIAGFIDSAKIQWSKAAVASVAAMGYMTGYPDQTFQPGKPVTRAEAISTLDRAKAGSTDVAVNKPAVVPAVIDDKNPATGVTRQAGSTNITPPSFYSTYPKLSNGTSTSVYLLVRINENGKAYFVVLDSGSAAPTAQQVRAGQDSKGNAVLSGSIALSGDDKGTVIINELEKSKTYDIYVVAEDTMYNLQSSPVKVKLDRVAPVFVSAETNIDGTEVRVTFSKEMDSSSKYKKQFRVLVNGINDTVTYVEPDDDNREVLILELDYAVLYGQTVTVAYTAGSVSAYDGTVLATFGAKSVTNSVIKPPSAPTGLNVSPENGGVLLEWNSVAGADGYTVYQSVQSDGPYKQISDSDRLRYRVTGLLNGVKYYFMVKAYNDGGESQNSIKAAATPISLPNTPTGLTASAGNGQITLNWNAVTGAIGYKVYRADSSNGPFTQVWGGKETSYKSEGLANGKTYYFVVKAVNTSGDSNDSNIVSATAVDSPNSPTGLTASAENGQVILNWNAVAEATGYKIYRSEISGGPYTQISAGWALTSYVATGLTKGKTYCFVV